jgi:hypothetical protein
MTLASRITRYLLDPLLHISAVLHIRSSSPYTPECHRYLPHVVGHEVEPLLRLLPNKRMSLPDSNMHTLFLAPDRPDAQSPHARGHIHGRRHGLLPCAMAGMGIEAQEASLEVRREAEVPGKMNLGKAIGKEVTQEA